MKSALTIVIFSWLFSTIVFADELPIANLLLHEGDNTITLTLRNGWNRDIRNLTVSLGEDNTPSWVQFTGGTEPVTVMAGDNGECLLSFTVSVTSAPAIEYTSLTVVLADDAGNLWTVPLPVSTGSSGDGPPVFETALSANYPNPSIQRPLSHTHLPIRHMSS